MSLCVSFTSLYLCGGLSLLFEQFLGQESLFLIGTHKSYSESIEPVQLYRFSVDIINCASASFDNWISASISGCCSFGFSYSCDCVTSLDIVASGCIWLRRGL